MLEIRLFGKFDLLQAGNPIVISSRPAQSLFAYLTLTAGTHHRREKLAGLLWPDSLEETARDNLRHALWQVRKALRSEASARYLIANDLTVAFDASCEYWIDAAELEKANNIESVDKLIEILSEYQGELLPGFYEEWVVLEREHLNSIFEQNMARLLSLLQDEKRWLDILDWGERWIKLGLRPEPAFRALMSAHAAKGDMSKVAVTYERCVKSLNELGVEPSEQTRALYEKLKTGMGILESGTVASKEANRLESPKTNLPTPYTSFIGRKKEVEEIMHTVGNNRLVTLTGPGGVGKTRLAIQSSNQMLNNFKNGVWWVELAPLKDDALIPQAVAYALGVIESPAQPLMESLKTFLRERQLLLVLDNCEHLIDACIQLTHDLLTQCANMKILATSREALDIMGEFEYPVQPLSIPAPEHQSLVDLLLEYEGIRLFAERANAKSGFKLSDQNAATVLQICRRLDGIPLAIELAAARTRTLTIDQIAERLNDLFSLFTQGNRTALPRHQTLRALIDWSFDLLSGRERILFRRLAVFAGGWTLEAAQVVCSGDGIEPSRVFNLLSFLVDKSLVIMQEQGRKTRYKVLETIRQYAHEKFTEAGEAKKIAKRHLRFFVNFAEEADSNLNGSEQVTWLDRLESEHDNFRTALSWALEENQIDLAARLGTSLYWFWLLHDHLSEGRQWLEQTIELTRHNTQKETKSPNDIALFAHILNHAGIFANFQGDYNLGYSRAEEGLTLSRKTGNKMLISQALFALGISSMHKEDFERAETFLEESLILTRELGDKSEITRSLTLLGSLALNQQDFVKAQSYYEEGLTIAYEIDDKTGISLFTGNLGLVALNELDYSTARERFIETLLLDREVGNKRFVVMDLVGLAGSACGIEHFEIATRLSGAVEKLREDIGFALDKEEQTLHERTLSVLRVKFDKTRFNQLWQEGQTMSMEQAIEYALKNLSNIAIT